MTEIEQTIEIGPGRYHVRKVGDLLHAERESRATLDLIKAGMGSATFSAQYQQAPVPPGGNMISATEEIIAAAVKAGGEFDATRRSNGRPRKYADDTARKRAWKKGRVTKLASGFVTGDERGDETTARAGSAEHVARLSQVNWRRTAPIWRGNVVSDATAFRLLTSPSGQESNY